MAKKGSLSVLVRDAEFDDSGKNRREKKLGVFIVEVTRATHGGELPVKQTSIRKAVKKNHGINIPPASSTEIVDILTAPYKQRTWLSSEGHSVALFSEDETLVGAQATGVLFLAYSLKNTDGEVDLDKWMELCESTLSCKTERCHELLEDLETCKYVTMRSEKAPKSFQIDPRAIKEDLFYLREAERADIRRQKPRSKR